MSEDTTATRKRKPGERDVAKCLKKLSEDQMVVEFNENQLPIGPTASYFDSELGMSSRKDLPYWIPNKKITVEEWRKFWIEIKIAWHIPNDDAEKVTIKRAKSMRKDFVSKKFREWKADPKKKNPILPYNYLDQTKWVECLKLRLTEESKAKSEKASISAKANKHPHKLGRMGYKGLEKKMDTLWPSLVKNRPVLAEMEDKRCKLWVAARKETESEAGNEDITQHDVTINKMIAAENNMKRNGTYGNGKSDPLIETLGPEHGGRTRAVSYCIGKSQVKGGYFKDCMERVDKTPEVNMSRERQSVCASPGFGGSGMDGSHIVYSDIENICRCELLWSFDSRSAQLTLANGQAYPTCDRYLDDILMHEHCVKVQVDYVHNNFMHIPVPHKSVKEGISIMEDTVNKFIQWPRKAIKILNASTHSASRQFQTSPQTRTYDIETSVQGYRPEMPSLFEDSNDTFVADNSILENIDNDALLDPNFNPFERLQNHHVEQQTITTVRTKPVRKPQSRQQKPKQTKAKQNKAKGKGNQSVAKPTFQDLQSEEIKIALEKIKERPEWHQNMVRRLQNHIGNIWKTEMSCAAASGMFISEQSCYIESEALLQLFVNGWVDVTIIFWFTFYFYKESGQNANRCAFFNANTITGDWCRSNRAEVEEHISSLCSFHKDKEYFLAPYLDSNHWSLFVIAPKKARVYILDSLMVAGKMNQSKYLLSEVIRAALSEINFTWTMVPCQQQPSNWECGFMVIKYMFDFVYTYQNRFPDLMVHDMTFVTETEINTLLENLMPHYFTEFGIA